jgi:tetratricopeptide (TPR) repeat protein
MADDAQTVAAEVNAAFSRVNEGSYYDVLGLAHDATEEQVRERFRELAKKYHSDRYATLNLTADVHEKMQKLLGHVSRAHATLSNAEKRKEYDAMLAMQAAGVPTDLGTIVEAESLFRAGKKLMDQGNNEAALEKFNKACKLNPAEPEFAATAAFCKYWTLPREGGAKPRDRHAVKLIVDHLANYLKEHPKSDTVAVYLGLLAKSEGNLEHAMGYFNEAYNINQRNVVAARELRLQNMRARKNTGFFQRLFAKKK